MITSLRMIQFIGIYGDRGFVPEKQRMYFLGSLHEDETFNEMQYDENGDEDGEEEIDLRCVVYYDSYEDYLHGNHRNVIPRDDCDWYTFSLPVNTNPETLEILSLTKRKR